MRTRRLLALVVAGSIPLVALAQDGSGAAGAAAAKKAATSAAKKAATAAVKKAVAPAAGKKAPAKKKAAAAPAKKTPAATAKKPGVTKGHAGRKARAAGKPSPTPAKKAAAQAAPAPAPAKKKRAHAKQASKAPKATTPTPPKATAAAAPAPAPAPTPAAKTPAAPIPAADPELVATARLFFQGLTSQVPAAMAELSAFPFDLDGETIRSKASLVSRLTELFQGKDFSRLPLYGMQTLPADAMVKQYGPPPARMGKLDLKDAWVAIADLGGHGYVAVFKKKYGRWVAVAYTD